MAGQNTQANHSVELTEPSNLVINAMVLTEEAIALLRINPDSSKTKIEQALTLIKDLDSYYTRHTVATLEKQGSTVVAASYKHYYPKVDLSLLHNKHELPTLSYKLKSNIVYHGDESKQSSSDGMYFDYTFAKASLITARDAINADHSLEAMANLRRVFEAIYVDPYFNVSANNH